MGWGQRISSAIEGLPDNAMWNQGLALLGASRDGGDWGEAQRAMQAWREGQQRQQVIENEMRRQKVGDARDERSAQREDSQYAAFEAAVRAADPAQQQELLALGPSGFAQRRNAQMEMDWRRQEADRDREFQARQGALNRAASAAARRDPRDAIGYRVDMARLSESGNSAGVTHSVRSMLLQQRDLLNRLADIGGVRQMVDAGNRVTLSRILQTSPEAPALIEQIRANQARLALLDAQDLKPVSNVDLEMLQGIQPNADMNLTASLGTIDTMLGQIDRDLSRYGEQVRWLDRYNGLTGTVNEGGQTFEEYFAAREAAPRRNFMRDPSRYSRTGPATRSVAALPQRAVEGAVAVDQESGRRLVYRGGQWVPEGR